MSAFLSCKRNDLWYSLFITQIFFSKMSDQVFLFKLYSCENITRCKYMQTINAQQTLRVLPRKRSTNPSKADDEHIYKKTGIRKRSGSYFFPKK